MGIWIERKAARETAQRVIKAFLFSFKKKTL